MKGIKIAARHKDLNQAQPKDEVLDTGLITLPIADKRKLTVVFESGVLYGAGGVDFPVGSLDHGLTYAPLFKGWVETVSETTGAKTGLKLSLPVANTPFVYSLKSDGKKIYGSIVGTALTYTPSTKLVYDFYVYLFGSRYDV